MGLTSPNAMKHFSFLIFLATLCFHLLFAKCLSSLIEKIRMAMSRTWDEALHDTPKDGGGMGVEESGELKQQPKLQSDPRKPAREWEEGSVEKNQHTAITPIKHFINIWEKKEIQQCRT